MFCSNICKKCSSKGGSIMKKEQKHNDVLCLLKYLISAILLFIALATFSLLICTYSSKNFSIEDKTTMLLVIIFSSYGAYLTYILLQD